MGRECDQTQRNVEMFLDWYIWFSSFEAWEWYTVKIARRHHWCFYSSSKLSKREVLEVERIKEPKLYNCGSPLFPDDSPLASNVVVWEAITYASPIELQFLNLVLIHFPQICYFCGLGEENLVNDDQIKEVWKLYAIVLPICFICQSDGKSPFCKLPSNIAKR